MVDVSTMPRLADDPDLLADAIRTFAEVDRTFASQGIRFASAGMKASADWVGDAADAFTRQHDVGRRAMAQISQSHRDFASLLEEYREAVVHAHHESNRAQAHVQSALDNFADQANHVTNQIGDALDDIVGGILDGIQDAIEAGINFVRQNVLHQQVDRGRQVAAESRAWSAPHVQVSLVHAASHEIHLPTFTDVERGVVAVGAKVADSIVEGVREFLGFGSGVLHQLVNLVHELERALVGAIQTAWRWACEAIRAVVDLGKKIAQTIVSVVIAGLRIQWEILEFVGRGIQAVVDIGTKIAVWVSRLDDGLFWGLVAAVEAQIYDQPRRYGSDESDFAATIAFLRDARVQKAADARRWLCDSAYDDQGAPRGWTRERNVVGPDGGFAAVFRNPETGELVVAFRGSEPTDGRDWHEDAMNAANVPTPQGVWATELALDVQRHPDHYGAEAGDHISFAGHSLGGSLAAIASLSTGLEATTFNAAGIGDGNYAAAQAASGGSGTEAHIVNYATTFDLLTNGQETAGMRPAAGDQVVVRTRDGIDNNGGGWIEAHGLDAFDWPPDGMSESNPDCVSQGPAF